MADPQTSESFDGVLIIGAGLAGLSAALAAAPRPVLVLAAAPLGEACASAWAQGGMAAALSEDDAPALHAADTLAAGAGLCNPAAVDILTEEGPEAVRWLAALGAPFDRGPGGGFLQSLEAAHSRARVARVGGDGAGLAIMQALIQAVRAAPHITLRESVRARALLQDTRGQVCGALVDSGEAISQIIAPVTILATGGVGGLYAVTTNPAAARGEGLALAALAGAEVLDPEFVQFHPTAMDLGADPAPLATEALRGDGARLVDESGRAFMVEYHPAGDLAPRDVVARAIETETKAGRRVYLDGRDAVGAEFPHAFPTAYAACIAAGVDPCTQPIPVTPAVHYHMGGVKADAEGATSLKGLFAIGECAATGVHGANRLASNSLLEAVVWGRRAGLAVRDLRVDPATPLPITPFPDLPPLVINQLRRQMSALAGVVRDAAGLGRLLTWIDNQMAAYGEALPLVSARLIAQSALDRCESRGGHFRADFPETRETAVHSLVTRASSQQARGGQNAHATRAA